jgi:hypothetical protein
MYRDGDKWIHKGTRSLPDGIKSEFAQTVIASDGGKTHTWTGASSIAGRKADELHDVWHRVNE